MDDFLKIYELLSSNWAGILVAVAAIFGAIGKVCTLLNALFPKVMPDGKLAKVQKVIANCSFGTKKAEIVTKKP